MRHVTCNMLHTHKYPQHTPHRNVVCKSQRCAPRHVSSKLCLHSVADDIACASHAKVFVQVMLDLVSKVAVNTEAHLGMVSAVEIKAVFAATLEKHVLNDKVSDKFFDESPPIEAAAEAAADGAIIHIKKEPVGIPGVPGPSASQPATEDACHTLQDLMEYVDDSGIQEAEGPASAAIRTM